jgi:hypothetical protein
VALVAALALPVSAQAAVSVESAALTPSTTQAGAHPSVTVDLAFEVGAGDDVKSVAVVLPQGLVGDPTVADRCTQEDFLADACDEAAQVGTTSATARLGVLPVAPLEVPGDVYNLRPNAGEAARLGVVLRPSVGDKVFLQSAATVSADTGYGLKTVFDDLPREAGGLDTQVTAMQLVLNDEAARGPFLTNPTSCREATTNVTITSYDEPDTPKSGSTSFTPTECDKLPFAPTLTGTVGGSGLTDRGISPALTAVIAPSGSGESNVTSAQVTLPPAVAANLTGLSRTCTQDAYAAGQCPESARVGSATARSPLITTAVTGPVVLVENSPFPSLVVQFGPPVPLTLTGSIGLVGSQVQNTFEGIPDLPLSRFELTVDGGELGLLMNNVDLCGLPERPVATAALVAHSGATAELSAPLEVQGCVPGPGDEAGGGTNEPRASLSLRYRRGLGSVRARFRAAEGGKALKRVRLRLPKGFLARKKGFRKGLRVKAGERRLGRQRVKLRGRVLTIAPGGKGARDVRIRWNRVKPARSLARRLRARPRLTFVAHLTPAGERTRRLPLTVRPAVGRS